MPRPGAGGSEQAVSAEDDPPVPLADDAVLDVDEVRRESDVDAVLERLDAELVGLVPVKTRIREIAALLLVDRMRTRFGLSSSRPALHMSFTGSPGTGKTTVALRMAELLRGLGYLRRGHLVSVTRDDLVGQYIGHTAPKTKEVLKRAMGGVLFIDEAYYLYKEDNERDYGAESVEILLQIMENQRDDLVVILAGYKDRMDDFFRSNPDYTVEELAAIAGLIAAEHEYVLPEDTVRVLRDYLDKRMRQPRFANARSVRNAIERARLRQANRLVSEPGASVTKQQLQTLEPADFLASRVFTDPPEAADAEG
jgi:probable Rubsico expression protein CbbX